MIGEITILNVIRVPPNARLVVETAEGRHESLSEIQSPAIRGQLLAAVGELIAFAGGYQKLVDAGVVPPIEYVMSRTAPKQEDVDEKGLKFLASLEEQTETLKSNDEEIDQPIVQTQEAGDTERSPSFVDEINAILQSNLHHDPQLAARSISLVNDAQGALRIQVDGNYYHSIEEIEDGRVKAAIAQARRDWEKR